MPSYDEFVNMRSRAEAAEADRDEARAEVERVTADRDRLIRANKAIIGENANLREAAVVSGSSRRAQVPAESFDRAALIARWVETFGFDLRSGVEVALAGQEADHVAGLITAAVEATRRAQGLAESFDRVIRAVIAWRRTIADSGEYALDDADALVEAVDALPYDDGELPGMWERADYTGGLDEVRSTTPPTGEQPVDLWFGIRPPSAPSDSR